MITIIQVLAIFAILFAVIPTTFYITEKKGLPEWLNFKPWNCWICCTFWSLIVIYATLGFAFNSYIIGIGGTLLAILNAIAMKINQKEKTESVFDERKINIIYED